MELTLLRKVSLEQKSITLTELCLPVDWSGNWYETKETLSGTEINYINRTVPAPIHAVWMITVIIQILGKQAKYD